VQKSRDREHHWNRVRAELDLAFRADHRAAVSAHLELSALHLRRLSELDGALEPAENLT
jgi:hypothetical protein